MKRGRLKSSSLSFFLRFLLTSYRPFSKRIRSFLNIIARLYSLVKQILWIVSQSSSHSSALMSCIVSKS